SILFFLPLLCFSQTVRLISNDIPYANGLPIYAAQVGPTFAGVAVDRDGSIYFTSEAIHGIYRYTANGRLSVVAGTGSQGFSGDGGPAASAALRYPAGLVFDADGNLFVSDTGNNRIRRIDKNQIITTIVGTGQASFAGNGGLPGTQSPINRPIGLA